MREDVQQESELRRYLLGELTLEEQVLLEQRLFLDTEYAQLAQSVEDDLIDDYVRDDLTAAEREKFETRFRNQADRNDINIAQALDRYLASGEPAAGRDADNLLAIPTLGRRHVREARATTNIPDDNRQVTVFPAPPRRNRFVWLALAAGVLIILSVIAWKVFQSTRRPAAEPLQAEGPQPTPTQSASPQQSQQTAEQRPTPDPNKTPSNERDRRQSERKPGISFATVTIFPSGSIRGSGQTNEVTIPAEAKNVLLKIPVVTVRNYERYRFELSGDGRVLVARNLNVSVDEKLDRIVSVLLPNKLLKEQGYEIRLRGLPTDGTGESTTYAFTVKKQQ